MKNTICQLEGGNERKICLICTMKIFVETLDKFGFPCYNMQAFCGLLRRYDESEMLEYLRKKFQKLFENLLTSRKQCGIINNTSALRKRLQKFFEKLLQNPLTKAGGCGIIPRLCARAAADRSLKIEQQEI